VSALPPRIAFYVAADGRRLAVRVWNANDSSRANVVFLHGISSHGGWYNRCCEHLAGAGFAVHFLDRRGSGLNADPPGDVDKWQTWIDDVASFLKKLGREKPAVLCGISWGGRLAAAVARRHPGLIRGLALICPGLYSRYEPGILGRMALASRAPLRLQNLQVRIPLRDPALFTNNPTWREFVATEPLTLRTVTWRFAREDRRLTRYAQQAATFLHMPLLMMLAGRDRIIDNWRTSGFFTRCAGAKNILIEYPNAAHTLEFEADPQPYFNDLSSWIARTVGCESCA
jgi:alpha-beta hydrolase superfamily lysophospholipase